MEGITAVGDSPQSSPDGSLDWSSFSRNESFPSASLFHDMEDNVSVVSSMLSKLEQYPPPPSNSLCTYSKTPTTSYSSMFTQEEYPLPPSNSRYPKTPTTPYTYTFTQLKEEEHPPPPSNTAQPKDAFSFDAFRLDTKEIDDEVNVALKELSSSYPDLHFFLGREEEQSEAGGSFEPFLMAGKKMPHVDSRQVAEQETMSQQQYM
eukprot:8410220-Ditylum_brightwellii.AAC.1